MHPPLFMCSTTVMRKEGVAAPAHPGLGCNNLDPCHRLYSIYVFIINLVVTPTSQTIFKATLADSKSNVDSLI